MANEHKQFTHLDTHGRAHMVDVSDRDVTVRTATAAGLVRVSEQVLSMLRDESLPKGDALSTARLAAIMGAKRTSDLIPLCHPISIAGIKVDVELVDGGVAVTATVRTNDRTGVEMEALTAVSIGALTVIDMVKAVDPAAQIEFVRVESKDGGRNGHWERS